MAIICIFSEQDQYCDCSTWLFYRLSLSLTFLIRIDLGFFLSIIFLGLSLLFPWIRFEKQDLIPLPRRLLFSVAALLIGALGFLALHLPVYCYAIHRGFAATAAASSPKVVMIRISGVIGINLEKYFLFNQVTGCRLQVTG